MFLEDFPKWQGDADPASGPLAHGRPRCRRALLLRKRASAKSFGLYRQNDNIVNPSPSRHPGVLCKGFICIPYSQSVTLPVLGSSGSCVSSFCDHMLKPGEHSFAQETLKAWQLGEQFLRLTPKKMEVLLDS